MAGLCFGLVVLLAAFTRGVPTTATTLSPWTEQLFGRAHPAPSGCREFNASSDLWAFVTSLHDDKQGLVDWLQELVGLTALVTAENPNKFVRSDQQTLDLLAAVLAELHLYCAVDKAEALVTSGRGASLIQKVNLKGLRVSDVNALNATIFFDKIYGPSVHENPNESVDPPKGDKDTAEETVLAGNMDTPPALQSNKDGLETPPALESNKDEVETPPALESSKHELETPPALESNNDEVETPSLLQSNKDELETPTALESNKDEVEASFPLQTNTNKTEAPSTIQGKGDEVEETLSSDDDLTILQELIKKIIVEKGLSGSLRDVKVADLFNGLPEGLVTESPTSHGYLPNSTSAYPLDTESSTLPDVGLRSSPDSSERTVPNGSITFPRSGEIKTLDDLNICPSGSFCAFSGRLLVTGFRAESLDQWMASRQAIERKFISVLAQVFLDSKFGSLFDSIFVTSVSLISDSTAMVEVELKLHPAEIEVNPSDLSSELGYVLDELFYPYKVDHLETSFKLLCSDKFSHCSVSFPLTPELEETAQPKSSPVMFSLYMLIVIFCIASLVWIAVGIRRCFRTRSLKRRIQNTSPVVLQELEAAYSSLNANHLYPSIHRNGTRSKSKSSIFDVEREKERMYQQIALRGKAGSMCSSSSSFEPALELRCHSTLGGRKRASSKVAQRCQRQPRHTGEDFFLGRRTTLHRFSLRRTSLKQIASSFRLPRGSRRPNPSPASSDSIGVENLAYVVESSSPDPSPPSSTSSDSHGYATIGAATSRKDDEQTAKATATVTVTVETEPDL